MQTTVLFEEITDSPEATQRLAARFAFQLHTGDVVLLEGDLGAGKTCFTGGIAEGLSVPARMVSSPTFSIMNRYEGRLPVFHFDLYRLQSTHEVFETGFQSFLDAGGVCVVEWPGKAAGLIDPPFYLVELRHIENGLRAVRISKTG